MKSYVLHGENLPQLHKILSQLTEQAKLEELDITRLDWKKTNENELKLAGRSQGLLSMGTLVIVDNFFANNKKAQEIIKELSKDGVNYIFVESKTLTPTVLKNLQKDFVIQGFPIPTLLFNFLNSVMPGNNKVALQQLQKVLEQDSGEFLYIMLARQVRNLIWIKEDYQTYKGADWQKQRLLSQANKFSSDGLKQLHTKLLELDRSNKRSQLPENLSASLEVLVMGI